MKGPPPLRALALLLLFAGAAYAAPRTAGTTWKATPDAEVVSARWPDRTGVERSVVATFPAGTLSRAEVLRFGLRELMAELGDRLRAWATTAAPSLVVTVSGTTISLEAGGSSAAAVERDLAAAQAERERLYTALLAEHWLRRTGPDELAYDHARIAAASAPVVRPLALALAVDLAPDDARAFAERALAYVQGIPYEAVTRDTFAPPLAVLRDPRADCDEKAALYAALLRAAAPSLPIAIVTMEQHAFVGLGLPARAGEQALDLDGTTWLVAEPAGPALHALGTLDARTERRLATGMAVARVP